MARKVGALSVDSRGIGHDDKINYRQSRDERIDIQQIFFICSVLMF